MRNYEIIFIIHPDQADQASSFIEKFSNQVKAKKGLIHRAEDIGLRKLAYPIQDQYKGGYVLMNVECDQVTIDEIKSSFKFDDSIIRDLILIKGSPESGQSALLKVTKIDSEKEKEKESYEREKSASNVPKDKASLIKKETVIDKDIGDSKKQELDADSKSSEENVEDKKTEDSEKEEIKEVRTELDDKKTEDSGEKNS
jgi:small subunit ribosomal protein S6